MSMTEIPGGRRLTIELSPEELERSYGAFDKFSRELLDNPPRIRFWVDVPDGEYAWSFIYLGMAVADAHTHSREAARFVMKLVNRLNEGNPGFKPYR